MSEQTPTTNTTNTTTTTTTPQVDEVAAVEPVAAAAAVDSSASGGAQQAAPEKAVTETSEATSIKVENNDTSSKQDQDQPKMDTTEIPAEKEPVKPAEALEKPAEIATEKPVAEAAPEKPVAGESGDKLAAEQQQPPKPAEGAPETKEDVKPVIAEADNNKVAEVAEEKKPEEKSEEKPMKVDVEPAATKEVEPASAPEQPQPPKQNDLPTRQYLDATVVPILHSALSQLAKIRPEDPIQYLCKFLQEQKNNFSSDPK